MEKPSSSKTELTIRRNYFWILSILWTVLVSSILLWSLYREKHETEEVARIQARNSFQKDLVYRRWAAGHGGVYVPMTDKTPPNPFLSHIKERDITTPSGRVLTLVNPAYMMRQAHEVGLEQYGSRGHITSLKPIRPANAADEWETKALQAFEQGVKEVSSIEKLDNQNYMRLMRPMITEQDCLKCHTEQGYKVGDLRGGISVSVPMAPIQAIARSHVLALSVGHLLLWLLGVGGISLGGQRLKERIQEHQQDNEALRISEANYHVIFDLANDAIFVHDIESGKILSANQKACQMYGYTQEELEKLTVGDISTGVSPYDQEHAWKRIEIAVKEGPQLFDWICKAKNGRTFWVEVNLKLTIIQGEERILAIVRDISKRRKAEEEQENILHDMRERVKELTCIYSVAKSVQQCDTLESLFQDVVKLIPPGWHYSEITCARVHFDGHEYVSDSFKETQWKQASDLVIDGEQRGSVEVYYLEEKSTLDEGPFLKEERDLIDGIAHTLSEAIKRMRAEEQMENLARFPSENPNPILRITKEGKLLYANSASGSLLTEWGCQEGQMVSSYWCHTVSEAFASGSQKRVETEHLDRTFSFEISPVFESGYANLYGRDITERKQAQMELQAAHDGLEQKVQKRTKELAETVEILHSEVADRKRLEKEVLTISEEEQRRIGRELHDGLQQELVGMTFNCERLKRKLATKSLPETEEAAIIHQLLKDSIDHARDITRMLYPIDLESKELTLALKQLTTRVEHLFGISCPFKYNEAISVKNHEKAINIYRIAQEAITNAIKHGKADNISISLDTNADITTLAVKDNGVGLAADHAETEGMGLRIMKYRASVIGASLDISPNTEGPGTHVICSFETKGNK
jgi:PAS domain S-box-containing protein